MTDPYESYDVAIKVLSVTGLVFSMAAVVLFYIFPGHRRFPVCILGWLCAGNILFMLSDIVVYWGNLLTPAGSDGSDGSHGDGNSVTCRLEYAADNIIISWSVCCNTFLAITLYLSVVHHISMEYDANPIYFKSFVISLVSWVFVFAVVAGLLPQLPGSQCVPLENYKYFTIVPNLILMAAEVVLLGMSVKMISKIIRAVRSETSNKHDRRLYYLMLRFVPTIMSQFLVILPQYVLAFMPPGEPYLERDTDIIFLLWAVGAILDASVLIVTNKELWQRFRMAYLWDFSSNSSDRDSTRTTAVAASSGYSGTDKAGIYT